MTGLRLGGLLADLAPEEALTEDVATGVWIALLAGVVVLGVFVGRRLIERRRRTPPGADRS